MSFKQFLKEQPWLTNTDIKVKCPFGDLILGGNEKYNFDFSLEMSQDNDFKSLITKNFPFLGNKKPEGVLPFYCKNHELIFMYDFDHNKAVKPRNNEDIKMLKALKQAITKRRERDKEKVPEFKFYT